MCPGWNYMAVSSRRITLLNNLTYAYLLCLRKVILRIRIQGHPPKWGNWDNLLRDKFSVVQNIKAKSKLLILVKDLNTELKFVSKS
jgi:hypothetical protein